MKFVISQTSLREQSISPVQGAILEDVLYVDQRTFGSAEEHDKRFPDNPWLHRGINHRKIKGGIARDIPDKAWTIEISSLEELLAFSTKHGQLVFSAIDSFIKNMPSIEIYNGYRE